MDFFVYNSLILYVSTVISSHEDTALLNNKWNELVLYLKLSSFFLTQRLAIHIQFTFSNSRKKLSKKMEVPLKNSYIA